MRVGTGLLSLLVGVAVAIGGSAAAVDMAWRPVGNPGNACDPQPQGCFGAMGNSYQIGTFEVTNAQYAEFLNAKAATDPLGLYNTGMGSGLGGITRTGAAGSFTYSAIAGRGEKPVNWVSFYDALRFANWMNNGKGSGATETGAYTLLGGLPEPSNGTTVTRNPGATFYVTSENEWYKAAYYNAPFHNYYDYPTGSDTLPSCASPTSVAPRANCNNAVGDLTDKASYPGSGSPYATLDQGGNVWEWNETIIAGSHRGVRGGGFLADASNVAGSARFDSDPTSDYPDVGFRLGGPARPVVTIDMKFVGNSGNACDPQSYGCVGAVAHNYDIGTYEVTNAQYAEFLNAKAATNLRALYTVAMGNPLPSSQYGGIARSGSMGTYTYSVIAGRGEMPVNFVTFFNALRFANWMNNGQGNADTESGSYTLDPGSDPAVPANGYTVTRSLSANIVVPTEDEWYKAAYYNAPTASYFDYPVRSDTPTTCTAPTSTPNSANCDAPDSDPNDPDVDNLTIKGSFTSSASPYGTFDQGGNVMEWNETIMSGGTTRGTPGGSFGYPANQLTGTSQFYGFAGGASEANGFRVVPEPGITVSLLTLVPFAYGLAHRRRRAN